MFYLGDRILRCQKCKNYLRGIDNSMLVREFTEDTEIIEFSTMVCPRCTSVFRNASNGDPRWQRTQLPPGIPVPGTEANERKILCKTCLLAGRPVHPKSNMGIVIFDAIPGMWNSPSDPEPKNNLIITAPETEFSAPGYSLKHIGLAKVFLAGGITGCPDWQKQAVKILDKRCNYLAIYNPRRENFPIGNPSESERQISWEFRQLQEANIIAFWFSEGSDNPIVLYELGMWGTSRSDEFNKIVVGVDTHYRRKQDVIVQVELANTQGIREEYIPVHEGFRKFMEELVIVCHGTNMIFEKEGDGLSG